ncbi:MAG: magnesium/cobalt efflux protein [Gammaproteobacteria bacterium]|nr:MAG: magnesium/cobalt efflux protein [Gammaproteobacteria bacterium]
MSVKIKIQAKFLKILKKIFDFRIKNTSDIYDLLTKAHQNNIIDDESLNMLEGVLSVSTLQARDLMIPRNKMITVDESCLFDEVLKIVIKSGHSRFPVLSKNKNEIIGIMLAKDLLNYKANNAPSMQMSDTMRPAKIIPESRPLNFLLKDFRTNRNHMAIVIDEYATVTGLITIEDVLEQIVGRIDDEYDIDNKNNITSHSDNLWSVDATTTINEFNKYFLTNLDAGVYDTIGGLLLNEFKSIPKPGDKKKIGLLNFKILKSDTRRIRIIQVQK